MDFERNTRDLFWYLMLNNIVFLLNNSSTKTLTSIIFRGNVSRHIIKLNEQNVIDDKGGIILILISSEKKTMSTSKLTDERLMMIPFVLNDNERTQREKIFRNWNEFFLCYEVNNLPFLILN